MGVRIYPQINEKGGIVRDNQGCKGTGRPPPEEVDESETEEGVEDGKSEPNPNETKSPTVDEYQ